MICRRRLVLFSPLLQSLGSKARMRTWRTSSASSLESRPLINKVVTEFVMDPAPAAFSALQLAKFICRTERLNLLNQAEIMFFDSSTRIIINSGSPLSQLYSTIMCEKTDQQVLQMANVCSQLSSPVSQVEELHLDHLACSWEPKQT